MGQVPCLPGGGLISIKKRNLFSFFLQLDNLVLVNEYIALDFYGVVFKLFFP